jgi:hypothetical protein
MADDVKKPEAPKETPLSSIPHGIGPMVAFPRGKPVKLEDIFSEDTKEYARAPGLIENQVFVLQNLTAGDLIEWSEASEGSEQKRLAGLRLIVKSTVDGEPGIDPGAQGVPIFDESHIGLLRKKSHKKTEAIVKAILKLNGMRVKGDSDQKNE